MCLHEKSSTSQAMVPLRKERFLWSLLQSFYNWNSSSSVHCIILRVHGSIYNVLKMILYVDEPFKADILKLATKELFTYSMLEGYCSVMDDMTITKCVSRTLNDHFQTSGERTLSSWTKGCVSL